MEPNPTTISGWITMSMTDPSNDYANGDGLATLEAIEQESDRLSEQWSTELDATVVIYYSLFRDEWYVEIEARHFGIYNTVPQLETALTTYMNGGS